MPAPRNCARPRRNRQDVSRDSRRIFATLIRLLGDFERAEEALHDAFRAAVEKWPAEGLPQNPVAWLVSAGRFKSIDKQTARQTLRTSRGSPRCFRGAHRPDDPARRARRMLEDDRLRLVFTCCHPALAPDAQVALTLREVCGLATEEIAAAFLTPAPTIAQRIVRAKAKIRDADIPYQVPSRDELPARLDSVLRVIYLVFNEGYSASSGESATRADLSGEAIRLGRLIVELVPEPEVQGLLALMLLHEVAARNARHCRRRIDSARRAGSLALESRAHRRRRRAGSHRARHPRGWRVFMQAAIAAVHAEAPSAVETDWREIVGLYDLLLRLTPSPIIALNRAVAMASERAGGRPRATRPAAG